jgi:hypothetical protein
MTYGLARPQWQELHNYDELNYTKDQNGSEAPNV